MQFQAYTRCIQKFNIILYYILWIALRRSKELVYVLIIQQLNWKLDLLQQSAISFYGDKEAYYCVFCYAFFVSGKLYKK